MRLLQSKPIEDQNEAALDTAVPAIQSQSVLIILYESLHVSMPRDDYDLKENVAYGHNCCTAIIIVSTYLHTFTISAIGCLFVHKNII